MKAIQPTYSGLPGKHEDQLAERGSATIIALLVLSLLTVFVTAALTRNTNEALAMRNDSEEGRAFYAAQASLETMTRNFNKVFETKINPTTTDLNAIRTKPVFGFSDYTFNQSIQPSATPYTVVIPGGDFSGLNAIRDAWQVNTVATSSSGTQVRLTRNFFNNRIPIFQFGIFYDGDLTLHNGPAFAFGGRVHTNKNFYLTPSGEAKFDSRVSASGDIITQVQRNGNPWSQWSDNTWVKNGSGTYIRLTNTMGSVLGGPDINSSDPDIPDGSTNPAWATHKAKFDGNLLDHTSELKLPIRLAGNDVENYGNVRIIRRGRKKPTGTTAATGGDAFSAGAPVTDATEDNSIVATERYYGKPGLRISLADFKNRLPGCASNNATLSAVTDECGVQLDSGSGTTYGYDPLPMIGLPNYDTTRFNPYRSYRGPHSDLNPTTNKRQTWIKVEIVDLDPVTGLPVTTDITKDFLSLGITEAAPTTTGKYTVADQTAFQLTPPGAGSPVSFYTTGTSEARDSRSVIKLQRWGIPGPQINTDANALTTNSAGTYKYIASGTNWNVVTELNTVVDANEFNRLDGYAEASLKINGSGTATTTKVVPFPIEMFDPREGIYNEDLNTTTAYGLNTVPMNGVMSMVDIDMKNMRRFLNGDFDNKFPPTGTIFSARGRGLRSTDIPQNNGWIVYMSDRRGDWNMDGDFGMEDIFGPNDGVMQINEDINSNGALDVGGVDSTSGQARPYVWEGTRYLTGGAGVPGNWGVADTYAKLLTPADPAGSDRHATGNKDLVAFADHRYYRRGFRLINAEVLPGQTDLANPSNTRGFTVAAEQAIYLLGNYNATGVSSVGAPTPASNYLPQATIANAPTVGHVPAAVAADQVAFLSNAWTDGNAWKNPFNASNRAASDTTYRMALLFGIPRARLNTSEPDQGGGDPGLDGGVHNFINMRESWSGDKLNYSGSMVSIFNARNNTGAFKCCGKVYSPPTRNWVFDASFLNPARIPPGTPMFQYVQVTGFQRTNE